MINTQLGPCSRSAPHVIVAMISIKLYDPSSVQTAVLCCALFVVANFSLDGTSSQLSVDDDIEGSTHSDVYF